MKSDLEHTGPVLLVAGFEDDRPGSVAEDDRDISTGAAEVEACRVDLATDDQNAPVAPRDDQRVGHLQREEKTAALRTKIDAGDVPGVDCLVQKERGSRKIVLGGQRREKNAVEVADLELGLLEGGQRRVARQIRGLLVLLHPTALEDSGALFDPLLARVHPLGQLGVGDDPIGYAHAGSGDV